MFEKNPNNGMNLIILNLLETYDKNHKLYLDSLKSSKIEISKNIFQISSQINFAKKVLEEKINFYVNKYRHQIEKIQKLSDDDFNCCNEFENFLQFDISGENLKLLSLNKFIQDQISLIEKIKNSEIFKNILNSTAEFNKLLYSKKYEFNHTLSNDKDSTKNQIDSLFENFKNPKRIDGNIFSPFKSKQKFLSLNQGISNSNNISKLKRNLELQENESIFNTEIINNIEDFAESIDRESKLLRNKKYRDDSLIDESKKIYKKKLKEEVETEENIRGKIKLLTESSKSPTVI